jgi:modulator of FtsH protease
VPDPAYTIEPWSDLFVAAAGASAALAGFVVVAVTINLDRILKYRGLPERALTTVLMLIAVLIVSLLGLAPGQSETAHGIEFLAIGLIMTAGFSVLATTAIATDDQPSYFASAIGIALFGSLPLVVGGVAVLTGSIGGLYWVVAALVMAILGAVANTWILLVEILR